MKKDDFKFVLVSFFAWRIWLFVFLFLGILFLPLQKNFIGGGLVNYLSNPAFRAWGNFDGEHYISIARNGYGLFEQAFFPVYPMLMKFLAYPLGGYGGFLNWAGLAISNISFFVALIGLYKLLVLDYKKDIVIMAVFLLLVFPTSFYFGSVYPTSLFFALTIWAFLLAREGKWWQASFLGLVASATWLEGTLLFPALAIELYLQKDKKIKILDFLPLFLIPIGLLSYMYYLYINKGDALAFIHSLPSFGEQRSSVPIILPQVFYRYIFKILPNLNYSYIPSIFSTFLELLVAILFLLLSIISFFKIRLSYAIFLALGYLLPTLSGSFSSLPRYVLVLFPAFLLMAIYLSKLSRAFKVVIFILLFISLGIAASLFLRGYWIS